MPSPSHRIMGPRTWTLASSVAVVALGATGFLWRSTGIATLTSLFPNSPNMRAEINTAAAMMFCDA